MPGPVLVVVIFTVLVPVSILPVVIFKVAAAILLFKISPVVAVVWFTVKIL